MTKNERTARGLLEIKAELSENATVGELVEVWTAYLDEQDLVIPMNYDEMAREIEDALGEQHFVCTSQACRAPTKEERIDCIAAKLKELSPMPEDLESAVREAVLSFRDKLQVKCTKQDHQLYSKLWGRDQHNQCTYRILGFGPFIEHIVSAVAPLCQKPEVSEDLEAAVRKAIGDSPPALTSLSLDEMAKHVCSAVALLLAERDGTLKMQHDAIVRMDKEIKELEKQRASIRLGIHDTLRRLERADSTTKWWADKNNIRNCLVGLQRTAAKESSDED